ncbi:GNAT family N-acetyltransferase [Jidongwangia harbinensis]|uniref:GNAT family N-acetyltransferase n=1 Tax=Jidongwangia harbinensis TaxID=2878561 RepID=UPI001CD9C87C|nr:GNAT family N-acetyltransferase [Jidongwangia harbinensis]MCA2218915.1 GNAT family N-acetyltransferase [Jidongwangia harbinensis]
MTRRTTLADAIDGGAVRLRWYRADDVPAVRAACDDPLTLRYLPALPEPYTDADAVWWVAEGAPAAFAVGGGNFAIADPATDRLVGGIGLSPLQDDEGAVGYWVAPWSRHRGVATAATRALTEHALSAGYGRLQLRTDVTNTASQRVALAAGYVREGVARAATVDRRGRRRDLIVWSRVAGDPPGPTARHLPDLPGGELTDGVVRLRPMRAGDAAEVHPVRASREVVANTVTRRAPSPAETERYCAGAPAAWLADRDVRLTVRDAVTGAFAGKVGLQLEDRSTAQADLDYYLAPACRGRGYATRAVRLLCRWAFTHTAIERLVAGVHVPNLASQRVLERCGFVREGHERGRLPDGAGGRTDLYTYALLRTADPEY